MPPFVTRVLIPGLLCLTAYGVGFVVGGLVPAVDTRGAERLNGLAFTPAERDSMADDLVEYTRSYERMRETSLSNAVAPALIFDPLPAGFTLPTGTEANVSTRIKMGQTSNVTALVKADNKFYFANKEVKVTLGGCGG